MHRILSTHTPELFAAAVAQAAERLRAGELVALPTETVYGLAANALDARAVERIFAAKGRPAHNPIIVHVADLPMARRCASNWPQLADRLARAFWPGPLTLVLPKSPGIPEIVTAGGPTVGIRWPRHPFIQAVIQACGFPLAAPSANPSNQVSPTEAVHVTRTLGELVPLVVDGGACQVGIESTVLDLTSTPPRVLRPGMIHGDALAAVTGRLATTEATGKGVLRSPGQLPKHYAPKARLQLRSWQDDVDLASQMAREGMVPARCHIIAHTRIPQGSLAEQVWVVPHDPEAFARALYGTLHRCDAAHARTVIVEAVPADGVWAGIADRLRRAQA